MLRDQVIGHNASLDEMFPDNSLEHRRITGSVPRAFRIDDRDRSAFADAKAVGFGAKDAALLRETELFQAPLQKIPRRQPALLLAAFRRGLVAT